jgi:hypothetical protein
MHAQVDARRVTVPLARDRNQRMEPLHLLHLILLSVWGGIVLAESVIEIAARDGDGMGRAATYHYWIDVLFEAPLLAGVLATGVVLSVRAWPLTPLHWFKIGAGLAAIAMNAYCVGQVILRKRHLADPARARRHHARVRHSAYVGIPFGLAAMALGLAYFRR